MVSQLVERNGSVKPATKQPPKSLLFEVGFFVSGEKKVYGSLRGVNTTHCGLCSRPDHQQERPPLFTLTLTVITT